MDSHETSQQGTDVDASRSTLCSQVSPVDEILQTYPECDLSDDALIYAGSAEWRDWRNHATGMERAMWKQFTRQQRAQVYMLCRSRRGHAQ